MDYKKVFNLKQFSISKIFWNSMEDIALPILSIILKQDGRSVKKIIFKNVYKSNCTPTGMYANSTDDIEDHIVYEISDFNKEEINNDTPGSPYNEFSYNISSLKSFIIKTEEYLIETIAESVTLKDIEN